MTYVLGYLLIGALVTIYFKCNLGPNDKLDSAEKLTLYVAFPLAWPMVLVAWVKVKLERWSKS
jgi:hypothetical protein